MTRETRRRPDGTIEVDVDQVAQGLDRARLD
jgi:hypothetical protein